jgi:alpha-beta hydrolase superfamily lysophospholipase
MRWSLVFVSLWMLLIQPAVAQPARLEGFWRGAATLNGDATPTLVEFAACADGVCAWLSLPDLDYEHLPLGAITEDPSGAISAGNLVLTPSGGRLTGTLSNHGPIHIDAMGHGGEAQVTLERGRAQRSEFVQEEITFNNGDVTLAGTLVRPRGRGPHPAIVAVLGSGPAVRWYSLGRAQDWARLGYAVLIYDKRGAGASGGDWLTSSLDDLADDATAAVRYLQSRRDIRADRVGFWAHSQGGWVAPHAIARGAPVAFLAATAGGAVSPLAVERHDYGATLDHLNVVGAERERADALVESYFSYLRGDIDLAGMRAALALVREAPWYRPLGINRVIPEQAVSAQWRWVPTYDPVVDIAALDIPVLAVLGGEDRPSLVSSTVAAWRTALADCTDATIVVVPGADHHLRVTTGQGWRRTSPAYEAALEAFLRRRALR